jgi:ABC-type dipeptide/oligopeptide/nickel transport system permease subunit
MSTAVGVLPVRLRLRLPGAAAWQLGIGAAIVTLLLALTIIYGLDPPRDATRGSLLLRFRPPGTSGLPLGADQLGRSLWSRALAGLPWSIGIAAVATTISLGLGTLVGLLGAFYGGRVRVAVSLAVDTVIAFPSLVLAVTVIAVIGRGFWPVALTLGLATWPIAARVIQAEALGVLARDYVTAAKLLGVAPASVLWVHVIPALRPVMLVMAAFLFADMLIIESALSFLGLGPPLSAPSWGNMLADSRQFLIQAPWMMFVPAGCIVTAVVGLNLLGDGIAAFTRARIHGLE